MKHPFVIGVQPIQFHGIPAYQLNGPQGATAIVSLQGAQVLSWIPAGGQEWLYLSENADYSGKSAIRGGVPVCFPQFSGQGNLPKHGLVRCIAWQRGGQALSTNATSLTLRLKDGETTKGYWPYSFSIALTVTLGSNDLKIAVEVENTDERTFEFTAALHSYFRIGDVGQMEIGGLCAVHYRDAANGNVERTQIEEPLRIAGEIDRVYHAAPTVEIREPGRTLVVETAGFPETVVWNPGSEKNTMLVDMGAEDHRRMVCVEAAAADEGIKLECGKSWKGSQRLLVPGN